MNTLRNVCFWGICSFIAINTFNAHATTVSYTLDNITLIDDNQITGMFDWTFDGEFGDGTGQFTMLEIPWTPYRLGDSDLKITFDIGKSIEITGVGSFHDSGLDIKLIFNQPLTPTQSTSINLVQSNFECCGNGFHDQKFNNGSISFVPIPATSWFFGSALLGLGAVKLRERSRIKYAEAHH